MTYTPITADVKAKYEYVRSGFWRDDPRPFSEEFDRWLAEHDREVIAKALRDMAARVRKDFADAGMTCGWVGALDDEATRIENSR